MPIVPMLRPGQGGAQAQGDSPPPPDPVYALMAATQMHAEGRLLAKDPGDGEYSPQRFEGIEVGKPAQSDISKQHPTPPHTPTPSSAYQDMIS